MKVWFIGMIGRVGGTTVALVVGGGAGVLAPFQEAEDKVV